MFQGASFKNVNLRMENLKVNCRFVLLTAAQEKLAQAAQQATGEARQQQQQQQQPPPAGQMEQPAAGGSGTAVQQGSGGAAEAGAGSSTDGVSSPMDVDPPGMCARLSASFSVIMIMVLSLGQYLMQKASPKPILYNC